MTDDKKPASQSQSDDSTKAHNRRSLVKRLFVGSGVISTAPLMSESWTRPLINATVLPSHAEMTYGVDGQ